MEIIELKICIKLTFLYIYKNIFFDAKTTAMMDFRDIEFGRADAKEEGAEYPDLLINGYLDSTGVINLALNCSTFLFLGYKGSGKTALLEHIRLTSPNYNCFVNDIPLSDFPYKSFAKIISGSSEQEAKLPLAWDWLLLVYAISSFAQDESIQTDMQEEWEETLNILRKLGIFPIKSVRDIVTQSAKRTFKINILSCFEFALEKNDQLIENDFIHIVSFLKQILQNIHSDNRHYIIIDGLDEILTSREIQYQSIAALITQAKALNVYFKNAHIPMKIIVLCRTDIFERLPHPNKNKIRQDSAYVFDWFDESSVAEYTKCNLIQLANLRGQLAYPELTDIFAEFFPSKYENQPIYQALLEYTRHTPRDFLQLLKNIQKYSNQTVSIANIEQGIKSYSINYFLPEIKDELVGYLEFFKIDTFINLLSTLRKRDFTLRDARNVASQNSIYETLNLEQIFTVLFECSAIGHLIGLESKHYIKYRNRNMCFNPNERIILHKGLWKALIV